MAENEKQTNTQDEKSKRSSPSTKGEKSDLVKTKTNMFDIYETQSLAAPLLKDFLGGLKRRGTKLDHKQRLARLRVEKKVEYNRDFSPDIPGPYSSQVPEIQKFLMSRSVAFRCIQSSQSTLLVFERARLVTGDWILKTCKYCGGKGH